MTLEAWSIFVYAILAFFLVVIQAAYASKTAGSDYGFSNREVPQPNKGAIGIRIDKTLDNFKEGSLMYLPLAILATSLSISNTWTFYAALITIISRSVYIPVYIVGIEKLRTLVWLPSFLAIPAMAYGILREIGI